MRAHTTCISPPELETVQLLAHLDGRADREVETHLEQCPHCRQRANNLAGFQEHMTARLYRLSCPSTIELGEYHLGMLPDVQREAVRHHLDTCPHCSSEVAQLKSYLSELTSDLEFSPLEKVKVLIAQLVSDMRPGDLSAPFSLAPVPAGLRGEQEGPLFYRAGDAQVTLEIQEDPQTPGSRTLVGLLIGIDPAGFQAHLWHGTERLAISGVDELGNFSVPDLEPGEYQLILSGPKTEIHIQSLHL